MICGCSPAPDSKLDSGESYNDLVRIAQAFKNKESNLLVASGGTIEQILTDDLNPPIHQRFILKLENGQTLLMLYNIDLASRIEDLRVGDYVSFKGRYFWNDKGGAIHWLHHDPSGRLAGGWVKHKGKIYR